MIQRIWDDFLKLIREEAGTRVVDTWFKAVTLHRWDAMSRIVYLQAPNTFVKNWINDHYLSLIQVHLGRLLNVEMPKVIFLETNEQKKPEQNDVKIVPALQVPTIQVKNELAKSNKKQFGHGNRVYSFDTFVVGPSNSLAYAAAYAVTEKPGILYNPLFIYGGSGLGKTHLLHAIGNEIKAQNKHAVTLYQTTDRFVSEFINAIRFDKVHKFQKKYQDVDVLLIDDVQFISKKEQTQEAFFHIFNALYDAHKQIVFTSDTFPQNMGGMAERLRSRLAWGLVTDIYLPSLETKVAILKKKAEAGQEQLSDEVAYYIASNVTSNIRELEGVLVRALAFAALTKQPITLDLVKRVILRTVPMKKRVVDFDCVIKSVYKQYQYSGDELRSKSRHKDLAFVRHVAIFLLKRLTDKSLRDIGNFLGGRDHTTIKHALDKMNKYLENNPDFQVQLKRIEEDIIHS